MKRRDMKRRDMLKLVGGAAAYAALGAPAIAQGVWPQRDKTVRVIVPFPPGAANDALGRLLAERLQSKFGCTAVVENRVGGAGLIGTKVVIQAEPDGYTLLASAFNTAVMPLVLKAADFNPEVDLEVVAEPRDEEDRILRREEARRQARDELPCLQDAVILAVLLGRRPRDVGGGRAQIGWFEELVP